MKKSLILSVGLSVGFMLSSCQNGLEELISESDVQNELATTRVNIIDELTDIIVL